MAKSNAPVGKMPSGRTIQSASKDQRLSGNPISTKRIGKK